MTEEMDGAVSEVMRLGGEQHRGEADVLPLAAATS
jgi:hypothetical protein